MQVNNEEQPNFIQLLRLRSKDKMVGKEDKQAC